MKKIVCFYLIISGLLFAGFHSYDRVTVPENKLENAISKIWKDKNVRLQKLKQNEINFCNNDLVVLTVLSGHDSLGFVIAKRVNSCRTGGCNIDNDEQAISFEYFDYFIITDFDFNVMKVNVYNYQATQGQEVMSQGWLRQFIGFSGQKQLVYGKDIEAISGATVSANAINEDIYATLNCMKKQLH